MQTRDSGGKEKFNIVTTSVFSKNISGEAAPAPPYPPNAFLLLTGKPFLLLTGKSLLLLET
jgi:hypothetical protein